MKCPKCNSAEIKFHGYHLGEGRIIILCRDCWEKMDGDFEHTVYLLTPAMVEAVRRVIDWYSFEQQVCVAIEDLDETFAPILKGDTDE